MSDWLIPSVTSPGTTGHDAGIIGHELQNSHGIEHDFNLSERIELWSSSASQAVKESAIAHFKENREGATLNWTQNRAKPKKYEAVGKELAAFEEALK